MKTEKLPSYFMSPRKALRTKFRQWMRILLSLWGSRWDRSWLRRMVASRLTAGACDWRPDRRPS